MHGDSTALSSTFSETIVLNCLLFILTYSVCIICSVNFFVSEKEMDDFENMEEFEPLPTIEEAAMMAAGIRPDDDSQENEGLVILPHQLPRPVWTPPSPPPAIEPFYQPLDGKPLGK